MSKIIIHRPEGIEEREMTPAEQVEFDKFPAQGQAFDDAVQAQKDLKASAKAKLIAGEPLTEDEANTIVV